MNGGAYMSGSTSRKSRNSRDIRKLDWSRQWDKAGFISWETRT